MGILVKSGISAFSGVLTTSFVAGTAFASDDGDELWLALLTSGTQTTTTDIQVEWSDDGSAYFKLAKSDGISSGVEAVDDFSVEHTGGAGGVGNKHHSYGPLSIPAGASIRISAKRTGGDATSAVAITAHVVRGT